MKKTLISAPIFCCFIVFLVTASCRQDPEKSGGEKIVYFEDGKTIRQKINYKNSFKNGPAFEYFENGRMKAKRFYINDTLNDSSLIYYKDGKIKSAQFYLNKLKHGCWREYNKEGHLYSEIYLKNGLLDSTSTEYTYRSGKVLTRVTYKDGLKNGLEEQYYSNGKPKSKAYYAYGLPCYGTEEWLDNGKQINNDFKINIQENDQVALQNKLSYLITLENPQKDDFVYRVLLAGEGHEVGSTYPILKTSRGFVLEFDVPKGGFVMETIVLAAYRSTGFKNTYIKKTSFNISKNSF